ncbi:multidrug transporter [Caulobacter radicis]|uniref:TolC family protein n=1 Tax=Caulobacter radicis TaxID=2172650 RepID=UPI000D577CBA|nr:TolC family protein [Caulobacter radicis]PVM88381.1 multidrug transporter [Caulobacter radicis]
MLRLSLTLMLLCSAPGLAAAQAPITAEKSAAPLTLAELLTVSARSSSQIVEQLARERQARSRALTAEGAFDTVFSVESRSRALGYYDGDQVEARATRPFGDNGGYVYGAYRLSRGDFPVYEDQAHTNALGEAKIGVLYALLRDRLVDERRTRRTLAASDIDIARFERQAVAIGVQTRAIIAYQNWIAAGWRLKAYRDLLGLAESRRGGIQRQVQLGAKPEILLTENEQNLVRRRALVVRAEGDLQVAANALSLYYRDAEGRPVMVDEGRLPMAADALAGVKVAAANADPAATRPDLRGLLSRVDQSQARLALAHNDLKPRFDLRLEVGKDVGSEGLGGPSRTPTEAVIGFRFSIPLQNRAARGKLDETRAEIDALQARGRFLRDQIAVEVEGIGVALHAAERLARAAEQERDLADRLAAAERRRFELGSSDFFLVNQREETATDAAVRLVDARARIATTRAELAAATVDQAALGLDAIE